MQFQHIRQATARLNYAGKTFLIDPMLAEKGAYPAFEGAVTGNTESNPLIDLPVALDTITASVDAVIITHLHLDHWDPVAAEKLDKTLPIFVQNDLDATIIGDNGFTDVRMLSESTPFGHITLHKTNGEHAEHLEQLPSEIQEAIGSVCGVIFTADNEQTLYLAGDTVFNDYVRSAIDTYQPDIIVLNAGGNALAGIGRVVMDEQDVLAVSKYSPAHLVSVHMEAVNHWTVSRHDLLRFAKENHFSHRLSIPMDGDMLTFKQSKTN